MEEKNLKAEVINIQLTEERLSVLIFSMFSAWLLSFIFEGQILYSLLYKYNAQSDGLILTGVVANFLGLATGGYFIRSKNSAKKLYQIAFPLFALISIIYYFPPSLLWIPGIGLASFVAGICVASWGYYLKSGTLKNHRIRTIADMLILSNLLMILLNMVAIYVSPIGGLGLSMAILLAAFALTFKLPGDSGHIEKEGPGDKGTGTNQKTIFSLLGFLFLFILVISINSGLMYRTINPAFSHLSWLVGWYWACPYIVALIIMRNLPARISRNYILYMAIAMIGISFILFLVLDRTIISYLLINTLMLGAFGVYDLFWWSILGGLLEFHHNSAKILGIGLSANVLGVILGGFADKILSLYRPDNFNSSLLALVVVCITLVLLPPLHKKLSVRLRDHAYLATGFSDTPAIEDNIVKAEREIPDAAFEFLSAREREVAALLLKGKTYKMIALELYISENTVKYFVKNIYSKYEVQNRGHLIDKINKQRDGTKV